MKKLIGYLLISCFIITTSCGGSKVPKDINKELWEESITITNILEKAYKKKDISKADSNKVIEFCIYNMKNSKLTLKEKEYVKKIFDLSGNIQFYIMQTKTGDTVKAEKNKKNVDKCLKDIEKFLKE